MNVSLEIAIEYRDNCDIYSEVKGLEGRILISIETVRRAQRSKR